MEKKEDKWKPLDKELSLQLTSKRETFVRGKTVELTKTKHAYNNI